MAVFDYECVNRQGEFIQGQINADGLSAAAERLKAMELSVINIKEHKVSKAKSFLSNEKKVTIEELSLFSRQLSAMISAGIPVTRALFTLSKQVKNPTFENALDTIAKNVEGGMDLTDAFGAYPEIFPELYVAMINSGELGGVLDKTLERLSEQLQKDKQIRDSINSATFYPKMLLGFALVVFFGMLLFLVPVFQKFIPAGTDVPGLTKFIFKMSSSLKERWYIWLLVIISVVGAIIAYTRSDAGKRLWDNIKFKIPVFGELIHKTVIARFSRTLATLLDGGIPVVQAMKSAGPTSGSMLVANAVNEATKRVEEGKSIAGPLEESGVFPPMVTHMIATGEETGQLPFLLEKIAEFYEEEVAVMAKGLASLIEPLMIVVVGVLVGGMLISLYLPIFTSVVSSGS